MDLHLSSVVVVVDVGCLFVGNRGCPLVEAAEPKW